MFAELVASRVMGSRKWQKALEVARFCGLVVAWCLAMLQLVANNRGIEDFRDRSQRDFCCSQVTEVHAADGVGLYFVIVDKALCACLSALLALRTLVDVVLFEMT